MHNILGTPEQEILSEFQNRVDLMGNLFPKWIKYDKIFTFLFLT